MMWHCNRSSKRQLTYPKLYRNISTWLNTILCCFSGIKYYFTKPTLRAHVRHIQQQDLDFSIILCCDVKSFGPQALNFEERALISNFRNFKKSINIGHEWKKRHKYLILMLNLKGNAQFVQNTTFGLWGKNDSSTPKNVL